MTRPEFTIPTGTAALAMLLLAGAAGCLVGPDYHEPDAPTAQEWLDPQSPQLQRSEKVVTRWWEVFNDPALNTLVETAHRQNPSLHAAAVRVLESQARRAFAFGLLFPQQQDATGGYSWNQASDNTGAPGVANSRTLNRINALADPRGALLRRAVGEPGIDGIYQNWDFGFGAAWELDIWGRYRRGIESANAQVLATIANYDDVLVSLIAEVAANYVLLRTQEEQLAVIFKNVEIQSRGFELAQAKFQGGTVTGLDPAQAEALLNDTRAQAAAFDARIQQTKSNLCILLGLPPQDLKDLLSPVRPIPTAPGKIAVGVPAELLRRRPDVRRTERQLAAQCALIGVAASEFYPSFSLTGNIGLSAEQFPDLWRGNSFQVFAGPSFRWAILNYGRIENSVRVQDASFQALISEYESVVLRAQGEVQIAMAGFHGALRQVQSLSQSVAAAERAVQLAEQQYAGGTADYTRVLNTQDFLTTEQSRLVFTRGDVAQKLVALYRALGGGWELREMQPLVPDSIKEQMKTRTNWGHMIESDRFAGP